MMLHVGFYMLSTVMVVFVLILVLLLSHVLLFFHDKLQHSKGVSFDVLP